LLKDKTPQFKISPECSYDFIELNDKTEKLIAAETDLLYFGTLSQRSETTRDTIQSLFNKNIKYFCDLNLRHNFFSKTMIEEALRVSSVIKINNNELEKLRTYFNLPAGLQSAAKELINEFDIDILCVTLGEEGAFISDGISSNINKYVPLRVVDTVGAGDAFAAVLCIGYLKKWNIERINKLANEFASDICGVDGAVPENDDIYHKYIREFENDS
jgi:fructokinase